MNWSDDHDDDKRVARDGAMMFWAVGWLVVALLVAFA